MENNIQKRISFEIDLNDSLKIKKINKTQVTILLK